LRVTWRKFLSTAGAAGVAPLLLGMTDKAGVRAPILGDGERRCESIHDWGRLPHTIKYGNARGVCEDAQGHIYLHHTVHPTSESPDTMVVFDERGEVVRSWGRQFKGWAHGLSIRKEGSEEFLYLCDYQHGIVTKHTLKGEEVFTLAYPAECTDGDSEQFLGAKRHGRFASVRGRGRPHCPWPYEVTLAPGWGWAAAVAAAASFKMR